MFGGDPTQRARYVLESLQRQGLSYREIARRSGLSRGEVFGILKGQHGASARTTERALSNLSQDFGLNVMTSEGQRWVDPASANAYSLNGEWWAAYKKVLHNRFTDLSPMRPFRGKYIDVTGPNGRERIYLLSDRDADTLRRLAELGEADPIEVTRGGSGKRRVR
jgi:transcriptional regulator with XRE-family HTH domain